MTTTGQVREALTSISNTLAAGITASRTVPDPAAALVAHIDQVRAFAEAMLRALGEVEPDPNAVTRPGLLCAGCIQEARNAEAEGKTPAPILPATTVINGLALCDVIGRHRIVTVVQQAVAQASAIWKPGDPLPGGMAS